ncbi:MULTISPECIES: hypothetical protein [Bradyrhizobium]|uniref:hypothetical protein n=1 Tax=Bradyrhizobium TaxID=374 RepID=UPI0012F4AA60|nr:MULTISPECIES: hypothetical protein [Bradyrhizobium]
MYDTPSAILFRRCNGKMKEMMQLGQRHIVMGGLVAAIHVLAMRDKERGCPEQARA